MMKFKRYSDIEEYKSEIMDILLEDEVVNNLLINLTPENIGDNLSKMLFSAVMDDLGTVVLIAICTKPFNLLLYEPKNTRYIDSYVCENDNTLASSTNEPIHEKQNDPAAFLADELKRISFFPPGVLAPRALAWRFAKSYCESIGGINSKLKTSMIIMQLDNLVENTKAPGFCRILCEEDLSFVPMWEQAFSIDCNIPVQSLIENEVRIRARLGKDIHFIWMDGEPVAQAVYGRETPNGGVINSVYTPPEFRGHGYATSVVAEVAKSIFNRGKKYCCLFANANNPVSCFIYHKLGFYDICELEEIKFDT